MRFFKKNLWERDLCFWNPELGKNILYIETPNHLNYVNVALLFFGGRGPCVFSQATKY